MKVLCDTSIIVELDRNNRSIRELLITLQDKNHELLISTISMAEIFTGSYLNRDIDIATIKCKEILNEFTWEVFNEKTAEIFGKLYSSLIIEDKDKSIDYPDIQIAASFLSSNCDIILTLNKKDFIKLPIIRDKVYTPDELVEYLKKSKPLS